MKTYSRLWERLYNTPLLLHPDKAAVIEAVFRAHLAGGLPSRRAMEDDGPPETAEQRAERLQAERAARYSGIELAYRPDKPYAMTTGGVALIPVMGTLVQRSSWMDAMSGLTSYSDIAQLVGAALGDNEVKAVLLELDTPGGETSGLFDLAATLVEGREPKPLWSFANEQAFSAGYAIGCSAEKFFLPRTGLAGSVGTIALHVDQSKRDASQGYVYTAIYAGAHKNDLSSHQPLSDPAREFVRKLVNDVNDIFIAHVASSRGLTEQAVRDTQAAIFTAPEAVEIGFADGIATLDETVDRLEQSLREPSQFFSTGPISAESPAADLSMEASMSTANNAAGGAGAKTYTQADIDAAVAAAIGTARTSAVAEAQARIQAIVGSDEAKGRADLANHLAFSTGMSADDAKAILAKSPAQAAPAAAADGAAGAAKGGKGGTGFDKAMSQVNNPSLGQDANGGEAKPPVVIDAQAIFARRAEVARS
ncbi:MAG TPA: S49 family peptidase [Burkholderiales bacterium]|nr:S49 family peptidase [Burkholderiales bacterium]